MFTINLQTTGLSTGDDRIIEFTAMKLLPDDTVGYLAPDRLLLLGVAPHRGHGWCSAACAVHDIVPSMLPFATTCKYIEFACNHNKHMHLFGTHHPPKAI